MCLKDYPFKQLSSQRHYATCQAWIWEHWWGVLLGRSFPRSRRVSKKSLSKPCKVGEVVRVKTQWAWGSWHTRGCSVSFMGTFVEGVWYLRLQCTFSKPIVFPFFFHKFKDKLKATGLAWCPDKDSVTHKSLVEMRRLARDETPFFSTMQLRATAMAWWPNNDNVILL